VLSIKEVIYKTTLSDLKSSTTGFKNEFLLRKIKAFKLSKTIHEPSRI